MRHREPVHLLALAGQGEPPIDVHAVAKVLGLAVENSWGLPNKVGALLDMEEPGYPVIAVNPRHPRTRRRFSIAHEIWEYYLWEKRHQRLERIPERYHAGFRCRWERLVNHLAADLLIPRPMLAREVLRCRDVVTLARAFDVSEEAMQRRLLEMRRDTRWIEHCIGRVLARA